MKEQYLIDIKYTDNNFDSNSFPFSLPVIKDIEQIRFHPKVTFIVGENGMGKSTLLEAIAIAYGFNPEGGSINFNFSTKESHSDLHNHIRIAKGIQRPKDGFFLRAESFYNVSSNIEELDLIKNYGDVSLHKQSHGESFFSLFLNRFRGHGIYLLDEPEAALSPNRQMSFLCRLDQLVKNYSQFIIVTHSPIIMAYPDSDILIISEEGIQKVKYEETEHYIQTKQFLNNPERFLKILLE